MYHEEQVTGDVHIKEEELGTEEEELPKLKQENEFDMDSRPQLVLPDGRILVDAYGFYKKLDPEDVCPDVPQIPAQNIVRRYTLVNHNKIAVQIINYGATITSILLPDRDGNTVDVSLGFDDITDYVCERDMRMGSTIGRYAGLISNGEFKISNREIYLSNNKGKDHIHGGCLGFDSVLWDSYVRRDRVIMTYSSYNGEEGYPGQLMVQVTFRLTKDNCLIIDTEARTSSPTPVCISHHLYLNLAGHAAGPDGLKQHCIMINADRYVVLEDGSDKPTGELRGVGGTYYDLRVPRPLGKGIERAPGQKGYDLTYCLTKGSPKNSITFAARLIHPESGRYVEMLTDHPGLYMYTCGDFPNPDLPAPIKYDENLTAFFKTKPQGPQQDDDGYIDPEIAKKMDKMDWPRPASLPDDDRIVEDDDIGAQLVPEDDERCETPPPRGLDDLDDSDFFPGNEILDSCAYGEELSDAARSIHQEDDIMEWKPPEPIHGKGGALYRNDGAVVLMPLEYPDSVKKREFPNPLLYPGEVYTRTVIYKFGVVPKRNESPIKLIENLLSQQNIPSAGDLGKFDEAKSGSEN